MKRASDIVIAHWPIIAMGYVSGKLLMQKADLLNLDERGLLFESFFQAADLADIEYSLPRYQHGKTEMHRMIDSMCELLKEFEEEIA